VVLGRRALNRALLARQHLLTRTDLPTIELIEHLVGLQAQAPLASYVGLWTRRAAFSAEELAGPMRSRRVARATLMRGTIHLVSDRDLLTLRPLVQPVVERGFRGQFGKAVAGVDLDVIVQAGRKLIDGQPLPRVQLRTELATRWPDVDADALAYGISYLLPVVQVTPRGVWGETGPAALQTIDSWLGRSLDAAPSIDELVLRYLAAFGPASVKDVQEWSGLTRLREVVDHLGPRLRVFLSPDGTTLYDVPEAPRPDPDTPAPVRFLPEYDNVLLSHADRTRVIPDGRKVPLPPGNGATAGTVLVDGTYQADWRTKRTGDAISLQIKALRRLTGEETDAVGNEGQRLLEFTSPGAAQVDVQVVTAD